ncbi:MAG: SDR family NAD(P)-dependent oxidoreductase [Actinomycetota bacterium]|nr:MAG: SDR family NAD(P)-dependent oxidoreductase [Actinomycetota bacterium]
MSTTTTNAQDRRFAGRNAIVTGASRGIGAALAERLAAEGANVLLVARTLDQHDRLPGSLRETAARCAAHGVLVEPFVADLASAESRAGIVPAALELFDGRVDICVNNAAAAMYASVIDYPAKRLRLTFEVNVYAPIELSQQVVPGMRQRGEGWIVNVSSATARHLDGPPYGRAGQEMGVYGASKAALNRITNAFAAELHGQGIRVNTIEPRAAVMSEGAAALVGDRVTAEQIEPMEAMVEATLALCDCEPDRTGATFVSLDVIEELGLTVRGLDGRPLA